MNDQPIGASVSYATTGRGEIAGQPFLELYLVANFEPEYRTEHSQIETHGL